MSEHVEPVFTDFEARKKLTSDELIKHFNEQAEVYDETWSCRQYKDHIYVTEGVADYFPKEQRSSVRILDVAAGTGLLAEQLWKRGFNNIDGLDPAEQMKVIASKKNVYTQYFVEYFNEETQLNANKYDCLVVAAGFNVGLLPCMTVVHMCRLVREGGLICFGIPDDRLTEVPDYIDRLEPLMTWLEEDGVWSLLDKTYKTDLYDGIVEGKIYRFVRKSGQCKPQVYSDRLKCRQQQR